MYPNLVHAFSTPANSLQGSSTGFGECRVTPVVPALPVYEKVIGNMPQPYLKP